MNYRNINLYELSEVCKDKAIIFDGDDKVFEGSLGDIPKELEKREIIDFGISKTFPIYQEYKLIIHLRGE